MNLKNLILNLNLQAQSVTTIVSTLNAKTISQTDSKLYGPAKIRKILSGTQNTTFSTAFATKATTDSVVNDALAEFRTVGLDFSDSDVRTTISGLGINNIIKNKILDIGIYSVSPWMAENQNNVDVTDIQVQDALLEINKEVRIEAARNTFEQYRVSVNGCLTQAQLDVLPAMGG